MTRGTEEKDAQAAWWRADRGMSSCSPVVQAGCQGVAGATGPSLQSMLTLAWHQVGASSEG